MDSVDSKDSKEETGSSREPEIMQIKRKSSKVLTTESMGVFLGRSAALFALLLPLGILFGVLFTARGWGGTVVRTLEPYYILSRGITAGGLGFIILLYLLDFSYWKGVWKVVRAVCLILSVLVIATGCILMAREYAAFPMLMYLMLVPAYVVLCKRTCFKGTDAHYFLSSLAPTLFLLGVLGIAAWIYLTMSPAVPEVWPGGDNAVKAIYYDKLLCKDHSLRCKGLLCPELLADDAIELETGSCQKFVDHNGCVVSTTKGKVGQYATVSDTHNHRPLNTWQEVAEYEIQMIDAASAAASVNGSMNASASAIASALNVNYSTVIIDYPSLKDADVDCATAAYLLYIGLLVCSVMLVIFSVVTYFIGRGMKRKSPRTQMRVFGMLSFLAVLGMYMATTIAGSTPQISNLIMLFSFVGLAMVGLMATAAIGWASIKTDLMSVPMLKSMVAAGQSDWLKAMAMYFVIPYMIFLGLSTVNQFFRIYLTPCAKKVGSKERKRWLTTIASNQLRMIKRWPFTDIFRKIAFIGILYYVMMVGISKFVMVFLSWLNGALALTQLGVTVGIFWSVGLFMFLLPPVPGVPVYVLGGVVLVQAFRRNGQPFALSVVIVTFICYSIKLAAIVIQQKVIGGGMSGSLFIRKTVGVNSITIKAIKMILTKPGMGIDKVAILCGGPDWPTSVLTGILKLSVFKMLFGSIPVVFLVFPCVMSGAFVNNPCDCDQPPCLPTDIIPNPSCQTLKDTKAMTSLFTGMASVSLLFASGVQSLALFSAMYFIESTASKNRATLTDPDGDYPNDPEVEKAELVDAEKKRISSAATVWSRVPTCQKVNMIMMFVQTMFYCLAFGTVASWCFVPFEVTDQIGFTEATCLKWLGPEPGADGHSRQKWETAIHPTYNRPFVGDDYRSKKIECMGKLGGKFYDVVIGPTNVSTGKNGYYLGWIMNAFVVTAFIHSQIFSCWAKKATKEVEAQIAGGLPLEDIVKEIRINSTKVTPENEVQAGEEEEEEEDSTNCRQQ